MRGLVAASQRPSMLRRYALGLPLVRPLTTMSSASATPVEDAIRTKVSSRQARASSALLLLAQDILANQRLCLVSNHRS